MNFTKNILPKHDVFIFDDIKNCENSFDFTKIEHLQGFRFDTVILSYRRYYDNNVVDNEFISKLKTIISFATLLDTDFSNLNIEFGFEKYFNFNLLENDCENLGLSFNAIENIIKTNSNIIITKNILSEFSLNFNNYVDSDNENILVESNATKSNFRFEKYMSNKDILLFENKDDYYDEDDSITNIIKNIYDVNSLVTIEF